MGRHSVARERRKPPVALAAVIAPAAVLFAVGADMHGHGAQPAPKPVTPTVVPAADTTPPCCVELVAAAPVAPPPPLIVGRDSASPVAAQAVSAASRYRVVDRALPPGVAPERGLQVRTILTARNISAVFPEIHQIGGVRPDALRWHPNGLALDVMIPDPSSSAGIALGNQIVAYVMENASRFGIQDAIWRGVYYTPSGGGQSGGYGHFDHVHVTTTGGGYPSGGEIYYR